MNPNGSPDRKNVLVELRPAISAEDVEAVRRLIAEYASSLGESICFTQHADEMANLAARYPVPEGGLWLATMEGTAAGCVALRRHDESQAELKRLYVDPRARGRGIARALMQVALRRAKELGYASVYLDTLPSMTSAQALYRDLGFRVTHDSSGPDDPVEMVLEL